MGLVRYGVALDHPEVKVCPPAPLHLALHPSTAYTVPPGLNTQVLSGRQRLPLTLFRECAGWAADTPSHPTCSPSPYLPVLPKVALHTPPYLHRLRHLRCIPP